jgi:phospholipid transport system substrate-binding protein
MLPRSILTATLVLITGVLAPATPAPAGSDPAAAFVDNLSSQLVVVAANPSLEQRRTGFRQLFHENFDVPVLGRFVLGRLVRIMSPSEQQEFLGLFENYVVATYCDRLSEYVGGGIAPRVTGSRTVSHGAIVSSEFSRASGPSSAGALGVDWRLTKHHHVYRISDIIIGGVSMAANGRSELEGVAERNGWQSQAILAVMRQESANAVMR